VMVEVMKVAMMEVAVTEGVELVAVKEMVRAAAGGRVVRKEAEDSAGVATAEEDLVVGTVGLGTGVVEKVLEPTEVAETAEATMAAVKVAVVMGMVAREVAGLVEVDSLLRCLEEASRNNILGRSGSGSTSAHQVAP